MTDGGSTILLYHGVTATPSCGIENFSSKHLAAAEFERQMMHLASSCNPITLREMAVRLTQGEPLPPKSVAVTFDDTFRNNATVALPILHRYGIPATFFVTTGLVGTDRKFWVDRLEHAINYTALQKMPSPLVGDKRIFDLATNRARISTVVALKSEMKAMSVFEREETLARFDEICPSSKKSEAVINYQNLTWEDVRRLSNPPDYEVGGHTVNHEILSRLDDDSLRSEIYDCIRTLSEQLALSIDLFSYPEGQEEHFNDYVIDILKSAGIVTCPTAIDGINYPGADPFLLRRVMVGFMGQSFPFDA